MENKELENNVKQNESNMNNDADTNKVETNNIETQSSNNNNNNNHNNIAAADFSAIFNVESEEQKPAPQIANVAPVVENNLPKENDNTITIQDQPKKSPKKDVFNGEERLLYEIRPEKEGNPIVVVLFFLLLFGSILALPYVSKKLDFDGGIKPVKTTEKEEETPDIYQFNKSSVRAKIGSLEFTNFVKSQKEKEYLLTFNITNTSDRPYQFKNKYYVIMMEDDKEVYRALIHSYDAIGSNAAAEISLVISERSYKNANKFKIEEITESRYPEVKLLETEGEYEVLTCNYLNDQIKYYFLDDKLSKLRETYIESMESNKNYEANKALYQEASKKYNGIENFTSNFILTTSDFTMINEFNHKDISDATLFSLKQYSFFRYMESKDVVSFEMEAQGYTCS